MHRLRPGLSLALTILLEVGALSALLDMGTAPWAKVAWRTPDLWLATAGPAVVVAATFRLAALCGAVWLLAATLLEVMLAAASAPGPNRPRVPGLPCGLRRRIDRAVAAVVATSTLAAPTAAVAAPGLPGHIPVPVPREVVVSHDQVDAPPAPPATPSPAARPPRPAGAAADLHTVVAGDHLWGIAEDVVTDARGGASTTEIAAYWRELIAANRDLPSGNPDLIHPGETVRLPPR